MFTLHWRQLFGHFQCIPLSRSLSHIYIFFFRRNAPFQKCSHSFSPFIMCFTLEQHPLSVILVHVHLQQID